MTLSRERIENAFYSVPCTDEIEFAHGLKIIDAIHAAIVADAEKQPDSNADALRDERVWQAAVALHASEKGEQDAFWAVDSAMRLHAEFAKRKGGA